MNRQELLVEANRGSRLAYLRRATEKFPGLTSQYFDEERSGFPVRGLGISFKGKPYALAIDEGEGVEILPYERVLADDREAAATTLELAMSWAQIDYAFESCGDVRVVFEGEEGFVEGMEDEEVRIEEDSRIRGLDVIVVSHSEKGYDARLSFGPGYIRGSKVALHPTARLDDHRGVVIDNKGPTVWNRDVESVDRVLTKRDYVGVIEAIPDGDPDSDRLMDLEPRDLVLVTYADRNVSPKRIIPQRAVVGTYHPTKRGYFHVSQGVGFRKGRRARFGLEGKVKVPYDQIVGVRMLQPFEKLRRVA